MSGWPPSRPPWETQDQPVLPPGDDPRYSRPQGSRVVIKPHEQSARGGSSWSPAPSYEASRGGALAGVIIGLAASVAIAWGAVQLTHVTWGEPPPAPQAPATSPDDTGAALAPLPTASASSAPAGTSSASTSPAGSATASGGAAGTAYVLTAPATAGGYPRTRPMSAAISQAGTAGAGELMQAVEAAGGKQASNVSGQYVIGGDQALGYAGFTGTFSPQKVIAAFGHLASGMTSESAGQHGGLLSCGTVTAPSPGSGAGTSCVWATPTTVGMVEFFGGGALETVTGSKAGQDTLNFRSGVEVPKGVTSTGTN